MVGSIIIPRRASMSEIVTREAACDSRACCRPARTSADLRGSARTSPDLRGGWRTFTDSVDFDFFVTPPHYGLHGLEVLLASASSDMASRRCSLQRSECRPRRREKHTTPPHVRTRSRPAVSLSLAVGIVGTNGRASPHITHGSRDSRVH
eukprot:5316070-Prymnesium_polylepis.1